MIKIILYPFFWGYKFIIASLLFFVPVSHYAKNTPDIEKLGNAMKINCKDVGEESCFSRLISLSACTFSYCVKSGKNVSESLAIADALFVLLAKGNGLSPRNMFDQNKISLNKRSERRPLSE